MKTESKYCLIVTGGSVDQNLLATVYEGAYGYPVHPYVIGVDKGLVKIVVLSIANGLVSLSGCIYAQQQRSFEISIGTGAVVIGLASVIIGTSLFKKVTFFRVTSSVVVGSILYKACVAVAMFAGISPNAIKLITAVLFLIILVISMDRKKVKAC